MIIGHGHDKAKYDKKGTLGVLKVRDSRFRVTDSLAGQGILVVESSL